MQNTRENKWTLFNLTNQIKIVLSISCVFWIFFFFQNAGSQLHFNFFLSLAWSNTQSASLNEHYPKLQFSACIWFPHAQSLIVPQGGNKKLKEHERSHSRLLYLTISHLLYRWGSDARVASFPFTSVITTHPGLLLFPLDTFHYPSASPPILHLLSPLIVNVDFGMQNSKVSDPPSP